MSDTRRWLAALVLAGVLYAATGLTFSALARGAATVQGHSVANLLAWAISAIVYAAHIGWEHLSRKSRPAITAFHAALGAALGSLLLALAATVRRWGTPGSHVGPMLIAVPVWPVLTGLPAFAVAWVAAAVLNVVRPVGSASSA